MRLLVLYQAKTPSLDQPGYFDGFERMLADRQLTAHAAIGYLGGAGPSGWTTLWQETLRTAYEMNADAVFLQFFHAPMPDPTEWIQKIKKLPSRPLLFSSLGDAFGRWIRSVPRSFRVASALSDVSFLTGMGHTARQLAAGGATNLVLMPNGCCQVRFSSEPELSDHESEFDVVFVGNRTSSRNLFSHVHWTARKRAQLVTAFTRRYGSRFGLFGKAWQGNPSWQGPVPYTEQVEIYRRSAVVLGGMPGGFNDYYTSDRAFIACASGVPFVDYWVKGVDLLLEPGRDWWLARSIEEMLRLCDQLLEMPRNDRLALGGATRRRILDHHTQYHRCVEMVEIAEQLLQARREGRRAAPPQLKFLRNPGPGCAPPDSIVAWRG